MKLDKNELWAGTFHGRHDGAPAKVTATLDNTRPKPYAWTCTCGARRSFPTNDGVFDTAWRHTHPTRLDRLRAWAARLLRTRAAR
ncbi:hypothetical protein ABZY81_38770 [Streptomyces sp. NPDC006514]|uniref:hypothetical protein n=1 Tax=Streptomyces sp. NPDC006514 TaxID=3154308 RepID=UPI0033B0652C